MNEMFLQSLTRVIIQKQYESWNFFTLLMAVNNVVRMCGFRQLRAFVCCRMISISKGSLYKEISKWGSRQFGKI